VCVGAEQARGAEEVVPGGAAGVTHHGEVQQQAEAGGGGGVDQEDLLYVHYAMLDGCSSQICMHPPSRHRQPYYHVFEVCNACDVYIKDQPLV